MAKLLESHSGCLRLSLLAHQDRQFSPFAISSDVNTFANNSQAFAWNPPPSHFLPARPALPFIRGKVCSLEMRHGRHDNSPACLWDCMERTDTMRVHTHRRHNWGGAISSSRPRVSPSPLSASLLTTLLPSQEGRNRRQHELPPPRLREPSRNFALRKRHCL